MNKGKNKPPCYGCVDRTEICHGECEAFQKWDKAHRKNREEISERKNIERQLDNRKRDAYSRKLYGEGAGVR